VDDLRPPSLKLVTTRLAAGRPTVVAIARDAQSGIDPLSLVFNYNNNVLLGASAYDPSTGLVLFAIPSGAPAIKAAKKRKNALLVASDNQEAKNVNTIGTNVLPNTNYKSLKVAVGTKPTVAWLVPLGNTCVRATARLAVVAGSTKKLKTVTFYNGKRKIGSSKPDSAGIAFKDWNVKKVKKGKHTLRAKVRDARGRTATASRIVRVCK
jgi:hypothetical protein